MTKPHGSNPRARRLARNGEAKLAREAKQAERRARDRERIVDSSFADEWVEPLPPKLADEPFA